MQRLSALSFRNLRVRPLRTLLTAVGIVLGVAVIVSISIANQSIYDGFEALFADVAGSAHLTVEASSRSEDGFNQRILERVQRIEGVRLAVPSTVNGTLLLLGDQEVSLEVYGIDPAVDAGVRPYKMVAGSFLSDDRRYTVVVVEDLADEYDIEVGEGITLLGAEDTVELRVVGIMAKEGPARRAKMVIPLLVSQEVFARGRKIDAIDVVAEEEIAQHTDSLDRLKAAIQSEIGDTLEVLYPAARAKVIAEALQGISMGLGFFAATALFAGAYLIFNTFSMTVVERMREIGMLRAIGTTKGQNFRLIFTEAIILGLAGSLVGLLFGLVLAVPMTYGLGASFGISGGFEFSIPPNSLIGGFVAGMAVTVVSALIPAIRAGRISPIQALAIRGRQRKTGWLIQHGWKAGLALLVVAELIPFIPMENVAAAMGIGQMSFLLFMIGVTLLVPRAISLLERLLRPITAILYGNEGRIGSSNINRVMGRTTTTVSALTMGVLMMIVMGAQSRSMMADVEAWIESAFRGDLFVSSFRPMRLELKGELATVEGVNMITPMVLQSAKVVGKVTAEGVTPLDEEIAFIAVDPLEYAQISEFEFASGQGDEAAMLNRLAEGGAVFVSTSIRQRYGVEKGDAVRLRTSRGLQDFVVAGVIVDYTWGGWSVTGSWGDMRRCFGTNKANLFIVDVAPGASVSEVSQRIEAAYGQRRHISVESSQEYRDRWLGDFMAIYVIFRVIVVIAIVVAALGVTNTMMMNVLERIREIGSLRAVGMTRRQVVRMILAEALIIGIVGGLLGMGFGAYSSFFAVQGMAAGTGWEIDLVLPASLLVAGLIVALGVSQIASLYPAWRAARVNIVRAVQYE